VTVAVPAAFGDVGGDADVLLILSPLSVSAVLIGATATATATLLTANAYLHGGLVLAEENRKAERDGRN
jgi:hypothetical protein